MLALSLFLALALSGCASENDITSQQETIPPRIFSLEEYRALNLDSWINKDAFISYDMLCNHLSKDMDLDLFFFHSAYDGVREAYNDRYRYCFIEEDRYYYVLDIFELPEDIAIEDYVATYYPRTTDIENKEDLRFAKSSGYYRVGNMWYCYSDSILDGIMLLDGICWETKTHRFTLRIAQIHFYDLESDSFVAKLLRESTAEKAILELNTHITRALAWRKFCRYWLPWILAAVISCVMIGTVYLISHRKAKKKTGKTGDGLREPF